MFTLIVRPWAGDTVRIRGLNHYFGKGEGRKIVLEDVSLRLGRGEIVIMTGPSGSGKTTLLTLIGGLRSVQEGSVQVLGHELCGLDAGDLVDIRRQIGFIFQMHNLFDALTARENVLLALELQPQLDRKTREEMARSILCRLGLEARMHAKPQQLSGGQRQRVAIARALVNQPRLILADEPTAALDKESGHEVLKVFHELTEELGCTILIVTHDHRVIETADTMVNMIDGRVVTNVNVDESVTLAKSLKKCSVFRGGDLGILSGVTQRLSLERPVAGTSLYREGDAGDKFYVVRAGVVQIQTLNSIGHMETSMLHSGDFFGETSLLTGAPRAESAMVVDDAELYVLTKPLFDEAVRTTPSFKEQLMNSYLWLLS